MRVLPLAASIIAMPFLCLAAEGGDSDRYWRQDLRVGPDKSGPQVSPKNESLKWRPQEPAGDPPVNVDRRLSTCLATQAQAQANSFFAPSLKTNTVAAVGALLGKCSAVVDEWEKSCIAAGDTQRSCELKSAIIGTKALKEAGAQ